MKTQATPIAVFSRTSHSNSGVDAELLIDFGTAVFKRRVPEPMRVHRGHLVQADLWGPAHGVLLLGRYLAGSATLMKLVTQPEVVPTRVDPRYLPTTAWDPFTILATKSGEAGESARHGAVAVRTSIHFALAVLYSSPAPRRVRHLLTTTAGRRWRRGRHEKSGNHPFSVAAPRAPSPFAMDMAQSGVARGKIYLGGQKREPIPLGWALNAAGARPPIRRASTASFSDGGAPGLRSLMVACSRRAQRQRFLSQVQPPYKTPRKHAGHSWGRHEHRGFPPLAQSTRAWDYIDAIKSVPRAQGFDESSTRARSSDTRTHRRDASSSPKHSSLSLADCRNRLDATCRYDSRPHAA